MTAKIAKWGNSAAVRLPKEIMDRLALRVGDAIEITERDNSVIITYIDDKTERLKAEAQRIKASSKNEYHLLEGSLGDGL